MTENGPQIKASANGGTLGGYKTRGVSNEEKRFISFTLDDVDKLLDRMALPLCVSCRDAGAMGGQSGFRAGHR